MIHAQTVTEGVGSVDGTVVDSLSRTISGARIVVQGRPAAFHLTIGSDQHGEFYASLPRGEYSITVEAEATKLSAEVEIHAGANVAIQFRFGVHGNGSVSMSNKSTSESQALAKPYNSLAWPTLFAGSWVAQPVNFTGLSDSILPLQSANAITWTGTTIRLEGMNATDPYQPGFPVLIGDPEAVTELTERNIGEFDQSAYAGSVGLFIGQSGAQWHGRLSSVSTGSALASGNLPVVPNRGDLQQSEQFRWLTADHGQLSGPIGSRADIYVSGSGQWDSRTIPVAVPGQNQNSRLLFGNAWGRFQPTPRDQLQAGYSGSRIDNSNWTMPAALESLVGWRMMPTLDLPPYGMNGLSEVDHLDSLQIGWTQEFAQASLAKTLNVRYQFLPAHLNTFPFPALSGQQSESELTTGVVSGAPPLSNMAIRTRQQVASTFDNGPISFLGLVHDLMLGAEYEQGKSRNRFTAPLGLNLITANGLPAEAVEMNTPLDSRDLVRSSEANALDRVHIGAFLTITLGLTADFSRGDLPAQSSPAGNYAPARTFAAKSDVISWNSLSPAVGFALRIPHLKQVVLRASYDRRYTPLAGQYLDFANPNSLSGLVYQWNDTNGNGSFQPSEQGMLLRRFGGEYSGVASSLSRPYADEFTVGAEASLPLHLSGNLQLYRRDEKNRLAVVNTGVPPQDYSPVVIHDPGPDSLPNTFDDQNLTAWNQNPQTLGNDQYLLTNPPGLRMMYKGFTAAVIGDYRYLTVNASFTAERSFGPTNPGDGVLENDSGVVGALYQDPNTLTNAANRDFFDRAYVGKLQTVSQLPRNFGNFNLSNTVNYTDGLVFARQLLVSGLNQGPFLVATTVRGSPEGGNRAEYILNWNLRLSRDFQLSRLHVTMALDLMNVLNARNRIQESDITGPAFNSRLPVAIQPARFARLGFGLDF